MTTGKVKAVTDSQGRYSISLPAGSHSVSAMRVGFYYTEQQVQLTAGATTTVNFDLRRGPTREIDWAAPPERLAELVATVHAVAHLRVTATESAVACRQEAQITTTVIDALKPPGLIAGANLTFCQEQWEAEPAPYPVGTELLVFLIEWNGTLVRSHGPHAVFLVENGRIESAPCRYRRYIGMPVAQFLAELRGMTVVSF